MNILVVNWQDIRNPLAGGAEVHLHEVFSRIAARGHDVTLSCSSFPGAPHEETIDGLRVVREGGRYLFNYRFLAAYLRRFRRERFDVVVDDMNKIPFFTPLFVGRPLQGVTHHLFGRSIFRETNAILASYVWLMESLAVGVYRRRRIPFIVGSPSTHAELLARGFSAEDVALIPYGLDHGLFRPDPSRRSGRPMIGYCGRLKKYKSADHLLRALPQVLRAVPDLRTVIVGDGDDRTRLEQAAREAGVADAVEFTGFVEERRKTELLQEMWLAVNTSSKEGWGLTVIEANACGTPVLAADVEGLRDAVREGETGELYPYGDIDALARGIIGLLRDQDKRVRLGTGALAWSRTFSWDAAADGTLEILQRLAGLR
jgi:glycosyltransferase involved in cell wall biosynthesis